MLRFKDADGQGSLLSPLACHPQYITLWTTNVTVHPSVGLLHHGNNPWAKWFDYGSGISRIQVYPEGNQLYSCNASRANSLQLLLDPLAFFQEKEILCFWVLGQSPLVAILDLAMLISIHLFPWFLCHLSQEGLRLSLPKWLSLVIWQFVNVQITSRAVFTPNKTGQLCHKETPMPIYKACLYLLRLRHCCISTGVSLSMCIWKLRTELAPNSASQLTSPK